MELERRSKELEERGKELRRKRERWEQAAGKKEEEEKPNWAPPFSHPDEEKRRIDRDEYWKRRKNMEGDQQER